jgi:sialate O-acetylesterase
MTSRNNLLFVLIAISTVFIIMPSPVMADVRMPQIFSDNMVLQRDTEITVWGWADPGEQVTVTLGGQNRVAETGIDGRWEVSLTSMKAGGPFKMLVNGKNSLEFSNILVGDVWICSGQSNMEWPVSRSADADNEIANADYPEIRLFTVPREIAVIPADDLAGGIWEECSPETVASFSAVGYFFGRHIHKETGVPVGLINSSWGGTIAETWISRETMGTIEDFKEVMASADLVDLKQRQDEIVNGGPNSFPTLLFNGMINPVTSFNIKGAIWYQGESNAGRAYQYREVFPALITDWRKQWGQEELPFFFVQLANFMAPVSDPVESGWAELREAQAMTLSLPATGMAVAIDIGEADDIHPLNKQDVGKRLALSALKVTYGRDIVHSGPVYDYMRVEGDRIRISFTSTGSGLIPKDKYGYLKGFAIAGKDRKFYWAKAIIENNDIVVYSDQVNNPVAVRYAWANNPDDANLYNNEGLPASPFRTDDWPGITFGVK